MAYCVYPFADGEPIGETFSVKLDGEMIPLHLARVSAYPFNRRWPGHQRQWEQSEEICFASFSQSGSVEVRVAPKFSVDDVVIRPLSKQISYRKEGGEIVFVMPEPMYLTVEFTGRHNALHLFSDLVGDYQTSGEVIYYGKGIHDAGQITLTSNQTLFLDEGAVVYACVSASEADHVRIIGRGILDNSKNQAKLLFESNAENNSSAVKNAVRQHTIQLEYCNYAEIDGITIRDSLVYNIRPVGCKNLTIKNVKIIGCWRYNSDGIDMHNCENVHISDCFIRTFDDSVCVKGFDCYYDGGTEEIERQVAEAMRKNHSESFRNVLVERCTIWNDWGKALEIGAETRAEEICNVTFRDCDIIHITGAPMDCCNVDYADVHDILYENICVEYDRVIPAPVIQKNDEEQYRNGNLSYVPPLFSSSVIFHHEYSAGGTRRGKNRNLTVRKIYLTSSGHEAKFEFSGYNEEHAVENVSVSEIYVDGRRISSAGELEITSGDFVRGLTFESAPVSLPETGKESKK